MNSKALEKAIEAGGGVFKLARSLDVTPGAIQTWRRVGEIPAKWVLRVERVTGIPCTKLRPDIYPAARIIPLEDVA